MASGSSHPSLSNLSDPASLAKLQILLVPIQLPNSPLSSQLYTQWSTLIKRHGTLRGDELSRAPNNPPSSSSGSTNQAGGSDNPGRSAQGHARGGGNNPKNRFFSSSGATSIARAGGGNHVHLTYPSHPPARHLANLSLLRISIFPLVVLGIAVEPPDSAGASDEGVQGYNLDGEQSATTPTGPTEVERNRASTHGSSLEVFSETVSTLFPPASPFPLVKRLILVPSTSPTSTPHPSPPKPPPKSKTPNAASEPREVAKSSTSTLAKNGERSRKGKEVIREVVHAPVDGVGSWIAHLLGEVVGEVMSELGDLATALETPSGLKTLSATLLPSLTSNQPEPNTNTLFPQSTTPTNGELPPRPSTSNPASAPQIQTVDGLSAASVGISLSRSLTPGGRPTSIGPPSLPPLQTNSIASGASQPTPIATTSTSSNPFRRSSAMATPFNRSNSAASLSSNATITSTHLSSGSKYTTAPLSGLAGGRLLKLLGDMYLLAGMYGDAIKCLDDASEKCRSVGDVLWEALAREGRAVAGICEAWEGRDGSSVTQPFPTSPIPVEILTHLLSALACLSRAPLPYPPTILSPSPQAAAGSFSFTPSNPSTPHTIGTGEGLLAYLHTGLSLRIAHFLLIVWSSAGWGSIALSSLLSHSLPRSFPPSPSPEEHRNITARRKRQKQLHGLSAKSQLDRQTILAHAETALGPHHRAMSKTEQLTLFAEVVWLSRWLDLPRHEAFVSREMVKRLAIVVVEGREESRRMGAGGLPRSDPAKNLPNGHSPQDSIASGPSTASKNHHAVGVRRRETADGNEGVLTLFERAVDIVGVNLLPLSASTSQAVQVHRSLGSSSSSSSSSSHFGWPELQVEMMKEGIAMAESLPDQLAVIRLCISTLRDLNSFMSSQSQAHLAKMLPNALAVVRRRGVNLGKLPWWTPGEVVLSVEVASLPPNRTPIEHSGEEMVVKDGLRDPFLYNPRSKTVEAGVSVLVANEQVEIFVTIRNPFAFDLHIKDLSLITSGAAFNANSTSCTIPGLAIQTVRITGMSSKPGVLQIRGVSIRLPDGSSCDILLPMMNESSRQHQHKRHSRISAEVSKYKRHGLEARFPTAIDGVRDSGQVEEPTRDENWLQCKVFAEQPLVWIKTTSLTHGTIMLYDGETSTIRITVENTSSVPVDFIKLSFEDSLSAAAQSVIAEAELSPQHAYELEWDMLNRPVFQWDCETGMRIPAGGRSTIVVSCLGKVGCTDGSIQIDYGYVNRPVMFTVYHMLEPHSFDIIRLIPPASGEDAKQPNGLFPSGVDGFPGLSSVGPPRGLTSRQSKRLSMVQSPIASTPGTPRIREMEEATLMETISSETDAEHCMVALSVSNVYGVPFEVSLSRTGIDGQADLGSSRLVPPGSTERLILPIARISLPTSVTCQPVPSLLNRQYVVEKNRKTPEQIQEERELFWYREALLKTLSATWIEPGSKRMGTMSLRDQPLSLPLLDVLRMDDVHVEINVSPREGQEIQPTEFIDLTLTVTNRSERAFRPFVRLEPLPTSSTEPSWAQTEPIRRPPPGVQPLTTKNVIFDGTLSSTLPAIEPGNTGQHRLSAMFLASGTFTFRAAVEEVILPDEQVTSAPKVRFSPVLKVNVVSPFRAV